MTGKYLEMQMNGHIVRPILAFREYIFSDVLPAFSNISERADKLGNEMYHRIGAQPAYDDSYDMADAAEAAQDYSLSWYEMMVSLRQTMRNLLATGLFHLAEQQIAKLTQDAGFMVPRPKNTNLIEVAKWFKEYMHLDLEMLQSWPLMNELRLVANTVKHAAGHSAEELFEVNRALFSNPDYEEIYEEFRQHGVEPTFGPVAAPMAGEDLFVNDKLLRTYVEGVLAFFKEIADYFERHGDDFFQAGSFILKVVPANSTPQTRMLSGVRNKHILDTSAWNALFDDPDRDLLIEAALSRTIFPTCIAITEVVANEDTTRRMDILRLMKTLGRDNRPMASPNQLIIMACEGYSKRAAMITLNAGIDAEGAWIALNDPTQVDEAAQRLALDFNEERENVMRTFSEGLRRGLQSIFMAETQRPRSIGSLIRHYSHDDNFLYEVINPIYKRATGTVLPRAELWSLLNSLYEWRMFLMGYACAIYQRAVQEQGYGHKRNPGHLDLWSATYLPICDVFVTRDKRQRRALKILTKANPRSSQVLSYAQWRQSLLAAPF